MPIGALTLSRKMMGPSALKVTCWGQNESEKLSLSQKKASSTYRRFVAHQSFGYGVHRMEYQKLGNACLIVVKSKFQREDCAHVCLHTGCSRAQHSRSARLFPFAIESWGHIARGEKTEEMEVDNSLRERKNKHKQLSVVCILI